jgi:hypothetical protein
MPVEAPMLIRKAFDGFAPTDSAADTQSGQSQPAQRRHTISRRKLSKFSKQNFQSSQENQPKVN